MTFADAACHGKHELFDSIDIHDHIEAKALCATCPALVACMREVADVIASGGYYGHPEGTWAGRLFVSTSSERRRLGKESRAERIAREDDAYTDSDARAAHAAYTAGDRSEWARVGHRVYGRRKKRRQRTGVAA